MPIDIKTKCPKHGLEPPVVKIGNKKFCGHCVERIFTEHNVHQIEMERIEYEPNNPSGPKTYCRCGNSWSGAGVACTSCGVVDHVSEAFWRILVAEKF